MYICNLNFVSELLSLKLYSRGSFKIRCIKNYKSCCKVRLYLSVTFKPVY